jgi:hypothetical protein
LAHHREVSFNPDSIADQRRGSALKDDFAADQPIGAEILDLVFRHGLSISF